jgi:hypothetical protein
MVTVHAASAYDALVTSLSKQRAAVLTGDYKAIDKSGNLVDFERAPAGQASMCVVATPGKGTVAGPVTKQALYNTASLNPSPELHTNKTRDCTARSR